MNKKGEYEGIFITVVVFAVLLALIFGMWIYPAMKPWWAEQDGRAELAQAEQNRQIAILEAQAKFESSKLLAQAEVERAKGVAQSNEIVGKSITEDYLKYLYVEGLQTNQMQTIYVPTNGIMPILDITSK